MEKERMLVDIHAHVSNVSCQVVKDDEKPKARISFHNLGFGKITAIKFNAKGYNSFGDLVTVYGNESFFIIIQDISVDKNATATNIEVSLPSDEIKKIELEETQICFADGTVTTYQGKKEIEFNVEKFSCEEQEGLELNALRDVFDSHVTYNVLETENGWICCCGRYNRTEDEKCSFCEHLLSEVKANVSEEGRKTAIEKKAALDEQRRIEAEKKAEEKKQNKKKKMLLLAIASVVALLLMLLIGRTIFLSGRSTYSSEDEMMEALQGRYTYYDASGEATQQIIISDNKVIHKYKYTDIDFDFEIKKWGYRNGTIHTFEKLIVTDEGDIKDGDRVYEKGGYMSSGTLDTDPLYESAYSVLDISNVTVTSNSSYTVCTGTITNNGKKTYKFVKVKGAFQNYSGTTLDTDWTYAVGSEGLAPGESKTFRMSVTKDYSISKCSVSIYDYD